jgi:hypothetical protein
MLKVLPIIFITLIDLLRSRGYEAANHAVSPYFCANINKTYFSTLHGTVLIVWIRECNQKGIEAVLRVYSDHKI